MTLEIRQVHEVIFYTFAYLVDCVPDIAHCRLNVLLYFGCCTLQNPLVLLNSLAVRVDEMFDEILKLFVR